MVTTKCFKNINYNNASQKRLAKFALIKYRINFWNYSIEKVTVDVLSRLASLIITVRLPLTALAIFSSTKNACYRTVQSNPAYLYVKTKGTSIYRAATAPSAIIALRYCTGLYFEL